MKAQESLNPALSPEIISTLTSLHPRSRILASFQKFQMSIFIGKTGSGEIICFSKASFILDLPRRLPLQRTAGEHSHSVEEFCPTDSPGGQHDRWRCLETPTSPMQHGEHSPSGAGYRYHKGDRREMLFFYFYWLWVFTVNIPGDYLGRWQSPGTPATATAPGITAVLPSCLAELCQEH